MFCLFNYNFFLLLNLVSLFSESPDLSLLVQNKGKGPLTVKISASDYVHLETTKILLLEKEYKKVLALTESLASVENSQN